MAVVPGRATLVKVQGSRFTCLIVKGQWKSLTFVSSTKGHCWAGFVPTFMHSVHYNLEGNKCMAFANFAELYDVPWTGRGAKRDAGAWNFQCRIQNQRALAIAVVASSCI